MTLDTSSLTQNLSAGSNHTLTLSLTNFTPQDANNTNFTSQYLMSVTYDDTNPVSQTNDTYLGFSVVKSANSSDI